MKEYAKTVKAMIMFQEKRCLPNRYQNTVELTKVKGGVGPLPLGEAE